MALKRAVVGRAAASTAVIAEMAGQLRSLGGVAVSVHLLAMGADADAVRTGTAGVEPVPGRIMFAGRLVEKKGFGDLLEACALLASQGRRFECRIVGGGALEAELRESVARLGLDHVVTLVGPVSQEIVREEISAAAVLAAPCIVGVDGNRDGLPTVLLEAMALGTPCVATDVTGIPEVVKDGRTGLAVAQHDPAALACALGRLLDDSDLRVRLATAARTLIEQRFDGIETSARWRAAVLAEPPSHTEVSRADRLRVR